MSTNTSPPGPSGGAGQTQNTALRHGAVPFSGGRRMSMLQSRSFDRAPGAALPPPMLGMRSSRRSFRLRIQSILAGLNGTTVPQETPVLPPSCTLPSGISDTGRLMRLMQQLRCAPRCSQTPFETLSRKYALRQGDIEKLILRIQGLKPGAPELPALLSRLDAVEKEVSMLARELFGAFARILGFPVEGALEYDKAEFDSAMEECFGSLEKSGSRVFRYRSIEVDVTDNLQANRVFSLYLGRKVFCPVSSAKKASAVEAFFSRVCSQPSSNDATPGMELYIARLAHVLFKDQPKTFSFSSDDLMLSTDFPAHASGCAERTKFSGGKREIFYDPTHRDALFESRRRVIPDAIYTGGKVRVITKDSAYNMRYAFLNAFMAKRIRSCRWSIFGRTVQQWLEKNPEFLKLAPGEKFISGDLESATDLFSGVPARTVIAQLCDTFDLPQEDFDQMCAFTCNAQLEAGLEIDQETAQVRMKYRQQTRGQLMGSILSFPILCLVSFAAATFGTAFHASFSRLADIKPHKALLLLRRYGGVGINGDDCVFKSASPDQWVHNVEAIGGKASRGKSLASEVSFTVNSELWEVYGSENDLAVYAPASIRPSLLCSIAGSERKSAAKDWLEYSRSPLLADKESFNVRGALRPHLPPSLSGCGVSREADPSDRTLAEVAAVKSTMLAGKLFRNPVSPVALRLRQDHPHLVPLHENPKRVEVTVPRSSVPALQNMIYGTLPTWEAPPSSRDETKFNFGAELARQIEASYSSMHFLTEGERVRLRRMYNDAWDLYERGDHILKMPLSLASDLGLVDVKSPLTPPRSFAVALPPSSPSAGIRPQGSRPTPVELRPHNYGLRGIRLRQVASTVVSAHLHSLTDQCPFRRTGVVQPPATQ